MIDHILKYKNAIAIQVWKNTFDKMEQHFVIKKSHKKLETKGMCLNTVKATCDKTKTVSC